MPDPPHVIQPRDLAKVVIASDAQLSPDGRLVAYTRTEMDLADDGYRSAIWTVTDSDSHRRVTRGPGRDWAPRWSPDGRWMAFLSDRGGQAAQLYLLPIAGGEPHRLTSLAGGAGPAIWSPDGSQLAFSARVAKDPAPAEDGAHDRRAQRPRVVTRAQYKTDGVGYTFDTVAHVFVATIDGGETSQRTAGDAEHVSPAWSPDGRRLAFARARTGVTDYSLFDLWVMDVDGGNARRLTDAVGRVAVPSWSPDGRLIAFYGHDEQEPGLGDAMVRVWVVPADGGPARAITAGYHRSVALARPPEATPPPAWSADGGSVVVPIADTGDVHLARVSVPDGAVRSVVGGGRQVQGFSLAAGRIAFCATEWHVPSDVYACREDGTNEHRLTRVNEDWLSPGILPRVERRVFVSPQGVELDGWVVHPVESGRGPVPLLVEIHGGPHSYHGNGFPTGSFHVFVLAARNWAVLELNPTGSGSYDKAFAHGIRGRWGEYDLPEQLAAVDALVASGLADRARLAVSGYSYGGFMTAWTITHTDRFKAAVVGAPVVNFESFYGTSDVGLWFGAWEVGGDLTRQREAYRRLSPINYVESVTTPTLIVHGEADDRCPIGQGEEFFTGLVAAGRVPVELVRYPGESHTFRGNGRPSHRIDIVQRVADWVHRYTVEQR